MSQFVLVFRLISIVDFILKILQFFNRTNCYICLCLISLWIDLQNSNRSHFNMYEKHFLANKSRVSEKVFDAHSWIKNFNATAHEFMFEISSTENIAYFRKKRERMRRRSAAFLLSS